jgi:flagellar hook-length control protein FliK
LVNGSLGSVSGQLEQALFQAASGEPDLALPGPVQQPVTLLQTVAQAGNGEPHALQMTPGVSSGLPSLVQTPQTSPLVINAPAIEVPLQQPGWGEALGQRVHWLIGQQSQHAQLQLNPPQLGPMEVRISVNQDQASVMFASHHAMVRDALDAAIPRLREYLAEQGLSLVDVDISQHSFAQQDQARNSHQQAADGFQHGNGMEFPAPGADEEMMVAASQVGRGMLDLYA